MQQEQVPDVFQKACDYYIQSYKHHEGIDLDARNIIYNAGLRSVSKLCLNVSIWPTLLCILTVKSLIFATL
jgi:hypothetical protein